MLLVGWLADKLQCMTWQPSAGGQWNKRLESMGPRDEKRRRDEEKSWGERRIGKRDRERAGNAECCLMASPQDLFAAFAAIPHGGRVSPPLKIHCTRLFPCRGREHLQNHIAWNQTMK